MSDLPSSSKKDPSTRIIIPASKPSLETNIHAKWSKTRGIYLNHETKVHNSNPIRLCRRFFRAKSFDFQAGDAPSTLGAFRLWFDFQTRSTLAAGCRPAHPDRSTFRPGGYAPQDGPSGAKCAFWVYISLNNDLANIRLTLQRVLNFGSGQKAQKYIKKAPPGMPEALKFIRLSKPIRLSFDFARRVPDGACKAPAGDLAGCYLLASRSMRSLQACKM